jgi:hypothetical protein
LRISDVADGFCGAERGEFVVKRGTSRGSCVVIFVDEECASFRQYSFDRAVRREG